MQPDFFVPIITITQEEYEAHESAIYPIPGTRFRDTTVRAGPTEGYAQHVLGRTSEATADRLAELGAPYQPGDVVGVTGLEARYERRWPARRPSEIQVLDADDEAVRTLDTIEGRAPVAVDTTIDRSVQTAVEQALVGVTEAGGHRRHRPRRATSGPWPPGRSART